MDIYERGNAVKFEVNFYDQDDNPVDVQECTYTVSSETGTVGSGTMESRGSGSYDTTFTIDEDAPVGRWVFRVDAVQAGNLPFRKSEIFGVKDVDVVGSL